MIDAQTIAFANRLADAAGAAIRPHFRRRIDVTDKGGARFDPVTEADKGVGAFFDPVTEADRGAERAMRDLIARERPNDGVLGEEFGETKGTRDLRWVLDPLDGTRAFISGRHEWGTLIALEENNVPILGIIDQPVLGERFTGHDGKSELCVAGKTTPLKTRACASLGSAILCATDSSSYFSANERAHFARVAKSARLTRYGGDCYLFAVLALGFVDLIVEAGFHAWDAAALIPVVEGAGGVITNWQGGSCSGGGQILAAGDARIHEAALKLLAG